MTRRLVMNLAVDQKKNRMSNKLEVPPKKSHNICIENNDMTAIQLIEELEFAIERNGGEDVEVRSAQQPKWAFEYSIDEAVTVCEVEDEFDDDDRTPPKSVVVYLSEGSQLGYLNENAAREMGW